MHLDRGRVQRESFDLDAHNLLRLRAHKDRRRLWDNIRGESSGHYLLTRLLLPDLARNASITFVSSGTHDAKQKTGRPEPRYVTAEVVAHDFEPGGNAGRRRYTTSKLCNVYCTYEYARRLAGSSDSRLQSLRVNALDPSLMPATDLARNYSAPLRFVSHYILPALSVFMSNVHSPATSGRRLAQLASGGEGSMTGKYFSDGKEIPSSTESYDMQNALDLWNTSAKMTRLLSEVSWQKHGCHVRVRAGAAASLGRVLGGDALL
jgi:NAD(P)-dependent dehydrogenase (short-subunit alcohol dehydrogenase family)